MFSGLVHEVGTVHGIEKNAKGATISISCAMKDLVPGESIAVHGSCLTVSRVIDHGFEAVASSETLHKTMLGELVAGAKVHLERALKADERLGGHLVTGHVDGIGTLSSRESAGDSLRVSFRVPSLIRPFIAPKGSITVNGVSLTVNAVEEHSFEVMLVPYTRAETTFDATPDGGRVNLEVDLIAKYVASLLGKPGVDGTGGR